MNLETTGFKLWIEVQVKKTTTAPPTTRQAMAPAESSLGPIGRSAGTGRRCAGSCAEWKEVPWLEIVAVE